MIASFAREVARIIDDRDFRQRMFIDRAVEPSGMRLEELAGFIRDDRKRADDRQRIGPEGGMSLSSRPQTSRSRTTGARHSSGRPVSAASSRVTRGRTAGR